MPPLPRASRPRASPAVWSALLSEAPCPFDEIGPGLLGDPQVPARLLRKLRRWQEEAGQRHTAGRTSRPRRPQLEEET